MVSIFIAVQTLIITRYIHFYSYQFIICYGFPFFMQNAVYYYLVIILQIYFTSNAELKTQIIIGRRKVMEESQLQRKCQKPKSFV